MSTRANIQKPLMEEHGHDESAFWQNDSRKCHWHEKGKVRLAHGEKRQGVVSHVAAATDWRHGTGGNLITEETWAEYELVRLPYDPAFKNPWMVWARVGGDYGYWGGKEVAMQFKEIQQFLQWERTTGAFKTKLNELVLPGDTRPRRIKAVMGTDQSQTHLLGKPDGLSIAKFNLSTKHRSKTNVRQAEKFYIPRDVVLEEVDVNVAGQRPDNGDDDEEEMERNVPEPPLGQSATSSKIAKLFSEGTYRGVVVSFTEDDEDGSEEAGYYHVVYADGDREDLNHAEYVDAYLRADTIDYWEGQLTVEAPVVPEIRLEYKPGDTYSFRLTDDSFKGLEQVAKELGWYQQGIRKGGKAKKKKVTGGDIFINKATKDLYRVMKVGRDHKNFGDLMGTITARPFVTHDGIVPHHTLPSNSRADISIVECDYTFVRPSAVITVTGSLSRSDGLRIALDPAAYEDAVGVLELAADWKWIDLYQDDEGMKKDPSSLMEIIGGLPMFVNELSWIAQVVHDFHNELEISPIVHCELAGRGIEYANGRATWDFRNGCTGKIAELEGLCRRAYSAYVIPQSLTAKYERRVRDYMRSYRMGVLSKDLDKMRAVIKTHRNMLDSYETFIRSDNADDEADTHILDMNSIITAINRALGNSRKELAS